MHINLWECPTKCYLRDSWAPLIGSRGRFLGWVVTTHRNGERRRAERFPLGFDERQESFHLLRATERYRQSRSHKKVFVPRPLPLAPRLPDRGKKLTSHP
ncbi:unnamed protein product, partial [Ixodes pacificus]